MKTLREIIVLLEQSKWEDIERRQTEVKVLQGSERRDSKEIVELKEE